MRRRGNFLLVIVVVVALGPLVRKAIDHEDDHENDYEKTRQLHTRLRGRRRPRSAGEETIEHEGRRRVRLWEGAEIFLVVALGLPFLLQQLES